MTKSELITYGAVAAQDATALAGLFERCDCPCYCQYWQFEGDHRQWQDRCANARDTSRRALEAELADGCLSGVVARQGTEIVGWARLEWASKMLKQYDSRLYRNLPVFAESLTTATAALACFLVDPKQRRHGVARALLAEVITLARSRGVTRLEAFPRGASDVTDEEQWLGPVQLYESAGFERIVDFAPYPVYRLTFSDG